MKKTHLLQLCLLILVTASCEKDKQIHLSFDRINGYVQKGPYLNGTAITISELSSGLVPTGKNFNSQILDNKGTFEIRNVELASQYVELRADGFYFDEVRNSNSAAQLTLFAISDLTRKSSLNVNILSNLEKGRVDYLVSGGTLFAQAKKQAQAEILAVFEINKADMAESELLDISKSGEDNAILLAISVIMQGYLTVPDLSELLANIATDMREDGVLNSQVLGTTLVNNAKTIRPDKIRQNLENRYKTLGLETTIPDFEKYVTQFIENTDFIFTAYIEYPLSGNYGSNILDREKIRYAKGYHSMKAVLPEGTDVKVKISGGNWGYPISQENTGWTHSEWNSSDSSRIFSAVRTGEIDYQIWLDAYIKIVYDSSTFPYKIDTLDYSKTKILVYENGAPLPTWAKEITVY